MKINKKVNTKLAIGVVFLVLAIAGWLVYWQASRFIVSQDKLQTHLGMTKSTNKNLNLNKNADADTIPAETVYKTNQTSQTKKTTLKKVSVGERYTSYDGSITVSGRYEEFNPDTMLGGGLCFSADEKTAYLIPREPDFWGPDEPDTRNPWFCFSNQTAAKKMLGVDDKKIFADKTVDCFSGPATVTVSHYVTDKLESETSDKAQLDKIVSSGKHSPTCGD